MKEQILQSSEGRMFQVLTDGRSVWVNAYDGSAVGRFGPGGVDVHRPVAEQRTKGQCLDCVPAKGFGPPARELWERFQRRMREFYGLELDDDWFPGGLE